MKSNNAFRLILCCGMLLIAVAAFAQTKNSSGQASITLLNCSAAPCYQNHTDWAVGKCEGADCAPLPQSASPNQAYSGGLGGPLLPLNQATDINWNVQVQNFAISGNTLKVFGFLNIKNTGSAPAYLASLVLNLQTKSGNSWKTQASDITTATAGTSAVFANICSGASSEGLSSFSVAPGVSGPLSVKYSDGDDAIAFNNPLNVGDNKIMLYEADFNIDAIHLAVGTAIRMEAIVTFTNSGSRGNGGSGASCKNNGSVDVDGNGTVDPYEAYYRSVPCRPTSAIPVLEYSNRTAVLSDPMSPVSSFNPNPQNLTTPPDLSDTSVLTQVLEEQNAGLTAAGPINVNSATTSIGGNATPGTATLTSTGIPLVWDRQTVFANATASGPGGLDNCAVLKGVAAPNLAPGVDDIVSLTDTASGQTFNFTCAAATNLEACAWPLFGGTTTNSGSACTYSQGGWGSKPNGLNPGYYLSTYFNQVYSQTHSVTIGWSGGYSVTFKDAAITVCNKKNVCTTSNVTAPQAIQAFLPQGGTPGVLNGNAINPTSTSASVFAAQVLALQLSVDFGNAGVGWGTATQAVGSVVYNGSGCEHGSSVSQILTDANKLLGGGSVDGCTVDQMNTLIDGIIQSFHDCKTIASTDGLFQ